MRIFVCAVLVRAYLYACVRVVTCAQYLCARIRVRVHNRVRLRLWGVLKKGKKKRFVINPVMTFQIRFISEKKAILSPNN